MATEVDLPELKPIKPRKGHSLYGQIADQLRELISDGTLAPNDQIPSELEMARAFGCARGTVRQARGLLEEEGWIRTERGRGAFVVATLPRL
jgi:DNA-binding GntR family transcriptional regulator